MSQPRTFGWHYSATALFSIACFPFSSNITKSDSGGRPFVLPRSSKIGSQFRQNVTTASITRLGATCDFPEIAVLYCHRSPSRRHQPRFDPDHDWTTAWSGPAFQRPMEILVDSST